MGLRIVSHNLLGPRKCSAEAGFLHGDTDVLGPFYCSFPHVFVHIDERMRSFVCHVVHGVSRNDAPSTSLQC